MIQHRTILVCQHRSCRKFGAANTLATLQAIAPPEVEVQGCTCLGHCGNGPMVLILPEEVWCSGVHSSDIKCIVDRFLKRLD